MRNRLVSRWPLIALCAVSIGLVSCETATTDPPLVDDGVTVRLIVEGPGRISYGSAFACVGDCTWTLPANEDVALRAVPSAGNVFVAWEGDCDTLPQRCERTFADGDTLTARFAPHALRLRVFGDGEGAFAIQGPGVNTTCDADCGVGLTRPLQLAITVFGSEGTTLGAWSAACADAPRDDYCSLLVSGNTDVRKRWVHPPVAADDPDYAIDWETTLFVPAADGVLRNDEDTDGDTLTAVLFATVSHGTLDLAADGGFTYTPDDGFTGQDVFVYRARDAIGNVSNNATVTITVVEVNRAPTANDAAYAIDNATTLVVLAPGVLTNDTDPNDDPLSALLVTNVTDGVLELDLDGSFTYVPDEGFVGNDTFTYAAFDGELESEVATVTITVTPAPTPDEP